MPIKACVPAIFQFEYMLSLVNFMFIINFFYDIDM